MFQVLQGEQGMTYFAGQSFVDEVELEDMAGQVAALDSSPPAAVRFIRLPCCQEVPRVAGDALLERQEGFPLLVRAGDAGMDSGEG